MDFGSSHVYAGVQSEVYYSSVPKERINKPPADSYDAVQDPVYESIDDAMKNKSSQPLPPLPDKPQVQENTYDHVADNNYREPETAWDAIPKKKPEIPAKPSMYKQHQTAYSKATTSLAESLRKALEDRDKEITKKSELRKSISVQEGKMPVAPPRRTRAKTLSSLPPPIPSRDIIDDDAALEPIQKEKQASVPDSLISFEKPLAAVPLLKPPPEIKKQTNVLPNAPFDPFAILEDTSSFPVENVLQPTLLAASSLNTAAVGKEVSATDTVTPDSIFSLADWDSTNSSDKFTNSRKNSSIASTNGGKPPKPPKPSNVYTLDSRKDAALPTKDTAQVGHAVSTATNDLTCFPHTKSLYPTLPDKCPMDTTTESKQTKVLPSAPSLSATLVREDIEFFESQLQTLSLSSQSPAQSSDGNSASHVKAVQAEHAKPSAPHLPQSMMRKVEDNAAPILQRANSLESVYASADTNIVCVKLGILAESKTSWRCEGVPSHCRVCGGISVGASPSQEWKCVFCEATNTSTAPSAPSNAAGDVTFVLQPSAHPTFANESLVVFCIDTSGSMCVSSRVESDSGSLFVSRLNSLQEAIIEQLNAIEAKKPHSRVALVSFNSEVQVLGDGSSEQKIVLSEYQLFDFDYLCHVGYQAAFPGLITNTRIQLEKTVRGLKESGSTALGPALLLSTAMASKLPGSQVIVCTDGRANVGVGSLETEDDYSMCHHFYNQATILAASRGVVVSILSIAGSDCRLVQLGKISDKTAGKVSVVEANKLTNGLGSIMSDNVLATNVSINLVTQKQLYFNNEEGTVGSSIGHFIGNVTNESEVTFRYGIRRDGDFASVPPPKDAYFQLKIMYRTPNGTVYLRVLTEKRAVTESREVAESEMNPAVIGTYASHAAAKLALQGDLDNAKQVTDAHKELLNRGIDLKSTVSSVQVQPESDVIYESVMKRMSDIRKELSQVETASTCSSDDQSRNATYHEPELIPEEEYDEDEISNAQVPPALPPRAYLDQTASKSTSKLSSSSAFESVLSKLPSIPKGSLLKKRKSKRHKEKIAMQYKDQTAQKMFKMSKATTFSFA